jgi:threonine aldolase
MMTIRTAGPTVDLSSDTQTRPTPGMRAAIAAAEVGDEQQRLDPTVAALCAEVAELLGHEAAVFLPSGTMCNVVAVATHTRRGDVVLADRLAHLSRAEAGGAAVIGNVLLEQVDGEGGLFGPEDVAAAGPSGSTVHRPPLGLVTMEQTHNYGGGTVWPLDRYEAVAEAAHARGVPVHVDGARLMNAVVASGVAAERWGRPVDSIWIDFTKGLGAPLGAVLAGPSDFIAAVWPWKHRVGGAMRQAGMMAAACRYALAHHVDRLAEDHANATRLAEGLRALGLAVLTPATNLVWIDPTSVGREAAELRDALAARGVLLSRVEERLRAVTHLDVDADAIERAIRCMATEVAG